MMGGIVRLFEKTAEGLLLEVAPDQADARRKGALVSRVSLEIDVLWTADEMAAREAEERAAEQSTEAAAADSADMQARKAAIAAKLGLTLDEVEVLLK